MREVEDLLVSRTPTYAAGFDRSTPSLEQATEAQVKPQFVEGDDDVPVASPEEAAVRESLRAVEQKILDIAESRKHAESRLVIKLEAEAAFQVESWARRREEEDWRRRAEVEVANRREGDKNTLAAHRAQVTLSENELRDVWLEERRVRSEMFRLNQTANDLLQRRLRAEEDAKLALLAEAQKARDEADKIHQENLIKLHHEEEAIRRVIARFNSRRTDLEIERQRHEAEAHKLEEERTRLSAATAAHLAETTRLRREAEEQLRLEQEQFKLQENELARLTESLAERRADLDSARQRAEADSQRIAEARERMRAAAEASQRTEHERLTLEAEIFKRAETERRLLEEARARAEEQQQQLETNERDRKEREAQRIVELETLRVAAESHAQIHREREQTLAAELRTLELATDTIRQRINELQNQQSVAAETYARLIDRLKQVEREALARAAGETQTRADLERSIKEQIDQLRVSETEQQQRIDQEVARRTAAERRLTLLRDRYQAEQAARIKAELQFDMWTDPVPTTSAVSSHQAAPMSEGLRGDTAEPVYQVGNLSSADPRLRADAVTALARLGNHDTFDLIVNCFDDEADLVRNAAARAILTLEPHRPVEPLTRALKTASHERAERIGKAISESGLAAQALKDLSLKNSESAYNGLCVLFAMAKTGEVAPLIRAIETHNDAEVRLAAVRLLKLSGREEVASAAVSRRLQPNGQ
jgi:hypothetical protein